MKFQETLGLSLIQYEICCLHTGWKAVSRFGPYTNFVSNFSNILSGSLISAKSGINLPTHICNDFNFFWIFCEALLERMIEEELLLLAYPLLFPQEQLVFFEVVVE